MTYDKFISRLDDILDALDEVGLTEELEELNANLEDVLFLMSEADPDDGEFADEMGDAAAELADLAGEYREIPETAALADELSAIAAQLTMALKNT